MIKIDDNTTADLDVLAEQHYNNIIEPLLANGVDYHKRNSLIGRIIVQRNKDNAIPNLRRVFFWNYLLENNFAKLKLIIISRPDVLKTIISDIEYNFGVGFFSNDIDYERATLTEFGRIVKDVFNYDLYRTKPECKENCERFKITYCPYCNMIEIQVITETNGLTGENKRLALLQLDHFYPQSRHPYLAVSFFNLIPGCAPCNAQIKLEKRFDIETHFNPFHKRFDDYFSFELDSLILNNEIDVNIKYTNKINYPNNAIRDFKIINRYNSSHKRVVFKLVNTFKNRSPKIRKSIKEQIKNLFHINESSTKLLLDQYNIPIDQKDINIVHLGKLKRDIAIHIGVLK